MVTYPMRRVRTTGVFNERRRLAIPRDLPGIPWSSQRVWLSEPYDNTDGDEALNHAGLSGSPNGRWRVVGKVKCLGEPHVSNSVGVDHGHRIMSLRTHQIVIG